jgi:hypothetical protein
MITRDDKDDVIPFTVGPISAKKLSGAFGPIKLLVLYYSHINLGQPALQAELRAHVIEILLKENPYGREGEVELAGVTHSFVYTVANDEISLYVVPGSFDDIDAAISSKIGPDKPAGGYIDWISPWLRAEPRQ